MTGLAISLVIYELPEVLGTHGGGGEGGAEGEHHGINGWTLLVGFVTIVVFVDGAQALAILPSKLIGLAAGTAVAAVITIAIHADVGPRVPFLGKLPPPDALLPLFSAGRRRPRAALRLRPSRHGARDRRRRLARQPARRSRRSGRPARHRAPSQPAADGAGLRQPRLLAVRRRAGRVLVASRDHHAPRRRTQARLEHRHDGHARPAAAVRRAAACSSFPWPRCRR